MSKGRKVEIDGLGTVHLRNVTDTGIIHFEVVGERPHRLEKLLIAATSHMPGIKPINPEHLVFEATSRKAGQLLDKVEEIFVAIVTLTTLPQPQPARVPTRIKSHERRGYHNRPPSLR